MADKITELKARLAGLGKLKVRVGVMGANASRVHPNGHGATVGEIAKRNHFGATNVPARPFLTVALRDHGDDVQKVISAALKSGKTPQEIGDLVGLFVVGAVQETISDGVPPPNAPSTVARKGSSTPLIETGIMRQSVTYEVDL